MEERATSELLHGAEAVFFKAMLDGWAGGGQKETIAELPRSKVLTFPLGPWLVKDFYFTTAHSNKSDGTVMIWHHDEPVWVMHFGGWCSEAVVSFLKRALLAGYHKQEFIGGRGLHGFSETIVETGNRLVYLNDDWAGSFESFRGREEVHELEADTYRFVAHRGVHDFCGGSLL